MDPLTMMMLGQAGLGIFNAFGAADDAAQQSMISMMQTEQRNTNNAIQTRLARVAKQKEWGQRYYNNNRIAESSGKAAGEEKTYIRHNYENETGNFSRKIQQRNANLDSILSGKNVPAGSQSAWAIKKANANRDKVILSSRKVNLEGTLRDVDRKGEATRENLNWGYTKGPVDVPEYSYEDPSSQYSNTLRMGLFETGMNLWLQDMQNEAGRPGRELADRQYHLAMMNIKPEHRGGWMEGDQLYGY